jgi:hypothetical protein
VKVSENLNEMCRAIDEAKGEKRTVMSIVCRPSDLTEWKKKAKENNMTLTQWVTRSLNNETK